MTWERLKAKLRCECVRSDRWRCASARHVYAGPCWCPCHKYAFVPKPNLDEKRQTQMKITGLTDMCRAGLRAQDTSSKTRLKWVTFGDPGVTTRKQRTLNRAARLQVSGYLTAMRATLQRKPFGRRAIRLGQSAARKWIRSAQLVFAFAEQEAAALRERAKKKMPTDWWRGNKTHAPEPKARQREGM